MVMLFCIIISVNKQTESIEEETAYTTNSRYAKRIK